jgi:hypothetical protein
MSGDNLFEQLNRLYAPRKIEQRGENAWFVAVKFLTMLQEQIEEDEDRRKLMSAWMKSVKEKDFKKFSRALRRYERQRQES